MRDQGNLTGFSSSTVEIVSKTLSLLKEAKPDLRRVCMLEVPTNPHFLLIRQGFENSCRAIGAVPTYARVDSANGIDVAIAEASRGGADALVLLPESFIIAHRIAIITAALTAGIPSVSFSAAFADDGALATYSAAPYEAVRRVAYDVDRMLRGAKPSDLSVEQPSQLTSTINLKTAASLGLRIRNSLLVQANKLIR